jgi:hypothetical protein
MKNTLLFVGWLISALALCAGVKIQSVTPHSLETWTVTGADKAALGHSSDLVLPANAQLSRGFAAELVSIEFRAKPVFAASAEDTAILELGPVALILTREGDQGCLMLDLGDSAPVVLPGRVALDEDGAGVSPVSLQLSYVRSSGAVTVTSFGQTSTFVCEASANPIEVVMTAGAKSALAIESLSIRESTPDDAALGRSNLGHTGSEAKGFSAAADGVNGARPQAIGFGMVGAPPPRAALATAATQGSSSLEIYTPPGGRTGRADAIRLSLPQTKKP